MADTTGQSVPSRVHVRITGGEYQEQLFYR